MSLPNPELLRSLSLPYYLVDVPTLESKYDSFREAFGRHFVNVAVGLSYKTFYVPRALKLLHTRGAYAEVVSDLEYELAQRIGVPSRKIILNGPGKSEELVHRALDNDSMVNLDSFSEVQYAISWREARRKAARVGLRVRLTLPDAENHASRFGLALSEIDLAADKLRNAGLEVSGLHAHLTSRTRKLSYYRQVARVLSEAMQRASLERLEWLDVGGGFGFAPATLVGYSFPSFDEYAAAIAQELAHLDLSTTMLIGEPGIALFGDTVSLYCSVLALKMIGERQLAVLDASVHTIKPTKHNVNLPTTAYATDYSVNTSEQTVYDLVGYTCLEDDVIARDIRLPTLQVGSVLRVDNVGAYTFVFKPQFIRGMPAFYLYTGDRVELARRADRFDDIFGAHVL